MCHTYLMYREEESYTERGVRKIPIPHYYGDQVRRFFILGALYISVAIFFFPDFVDQAPVAFIIALVILIALAAGLTNPKQSFTAMLNMALAAALFALFQYEAVYGYQTNVELGLSIIRQGAAIIFLIALYFATKTVRGLMVR